MIYPDVQLSLEPPGLDTEDDDEPPEPTLRLWVSLIEGDDTARTGASLFMLPEDVNGTDLADGLVRALLGVARQRGPELLAAVLERMRREVA